MNTLTELLGHLARNILGNMEYTAHTWPDSEGTEMNTFDRDIWQFSLEYSWPRVMKVYTFDDIPNFF